jgi:hypothetical protein
MGAHSSHTTQGTKQRGGGSVESHAKRGEGIGPVGPGGGSFDGIGADRQGPVRCRCGQ